MIDDSGEVRVLRTDVKFLIQKPKLSVVTGNMQILLVRQTRASEAERLGVFIQVFLKRKSALAVSFTWGCQARMQPSAGAVCGAVQRRAPRGEPRVLPGRPAHVQ